MRPFGLMGPSLPLCLPFFLRGLLLLGLGLTLSPVTSHFKTLNYICKDTLLNKLAFTGSGWTYLFWGCGYCLVHYEYICYLRSFAKNRKVRVNMYQQLGFLPRLRPQVLWDGTQLPEPLIANCSPLSPAKRNKGLGRAPKAKQL